MRTTDRFLVHQVTKTDKLRQPLAEVSQNVGNSKEPLIKGQLFTASSILDSLCFFIKKSYFGELHR